MWWVLTFGNLTAKIINDMRVKDLSWPNRLLRGILWGNVAKFRCPLYKLWSDWTQMGTGSLVRIPTCNCPARSLIFIFHDQLGELHIAQGWLEPFLAYLPEFNIHLGLVYSVLWQDKPQKRFRLCLKQHLLVSNFWNRCIHAFITYFTMEVSASSQTQSGPCSRLLMSVSGEERTTVRCCSTRHTWESDSAFVAEREFCDVLWLCVTLCNHHWRLCTQKIFTPLNYC